MNLNTISKKIGLGFVLMIAILATSVLITLSLVRDVNQAYDHINNVSQPSARASIGLKADINETIADLRGWVLLNQEQFKINREAKWRDEIRPQLAELEIISSNWTSSKSRELLGNLKPLLNRLDEAQRDAESLVMEDTDEALLILDGEISSLNQQIKEIVNELAVHQEGVLQADLSRISAEISSLRDIVWVLLITGLVISIVLSYLIIQSITPSIDEAVNVAKRIGAGNLDADVNISGSKELKNLGTALVEMRDALKQKVEETNNYDWLTTGQNKLSNTMRGDQEINELADNIIGFVTQYIDASIGSLYLMDDAREKLHLSGKYAFNDEDEVQSTFKMGEGLIGQAAANKKATFIHGMKTKYISVKSSILETPPNHVMATPFMADGEILGVVEIGKFEEFTDLQMEFIESNLENIGISMKSAIARHQIQQLLEETQLQSEELQQQQEELEQNNEELEEQTQKLKEQQEELQAANEELEEQTQVVEQKNQDLETARTEIELKARQLEISSKYKSEFLANMSHELRTPLNSLLILANDLNQNKNGNLSDEELESAEVIVNSGRDLLNLINEILDLSKIEAGKMELNISEVNLADIATDLSRKFKKQAEEKEVKFEVHLDNALPPSINTDRQRFEQILKNLLSNAIKFTEEGTVSIRFTRNAGDYLSVEVKDTGIGIPKEKQAIIFEAFQQADGGTARRYGGTGLGLSISRELAKLLKGKVLVESKEGAGSTFTLTIPINSTTPSVEIQPPPQKKKVTHTEAHRFYNYPAIDDQRDEIKRGDNIILIVEDDREFAKILAGQASQKGFKYLAASTGEDALVLAEKYRPTAIILDLKLPGIDGHMVLKELKGNPEIRHIPVHIISSEEKSLDPIKSGAVQYITKPVTKNQLDDAFIRIEDFISRKMKSLLIVEDNEPLRKSIVKLIGNGDVVCIEADTGKKAIEHINEQPVDCIVLDIGLPDMNGFEFIKKLESDKKIKTPPIVVYTGKELSRSETEQLQEYAETVIVKGIKSEERLLDETALFLHRTVKNLPQNQQEIISNLYDKEKLFLDKKILLVDDDMRNVFALSKVLRERGMNIIKAENGVVALEKLEENPDTDLVLMDIMMPVMDGYECMQKIRNEKKLKDLPVVALTAKAMKNDRQKCLDAGANDYITKPVDIERLLSLMRIWIKK